jgi:IclR family acetate operon transcriptional repressor
MTGFRPVSEAMQSSLTTLRVLEIVGEHQPVAVAEVAKLIARPKSTAQRALLTLHEGGWIRPSGADRTRWTLTARIVEVAGKVGNETGLRDAAGPVLAWLRDQTRESVSLCVLDGDATVSVDFLEGRHTIRFMGPVGVRLPLHAGGSGKVILALLSEAEQTRALAGRLRRYTSQTVTSRRELESELSEIRERGYAVSHGEVSLEAAGVAAAVRAPDGRPIASVALLLPAVRARTDAEIAPLAEAVCKAAAEIEMALEIGPSIT